MFACKVCQSKLLNIQCSVRFNELYGKNEELGIPNDGPDAYFSDRDRLFQIQRDRQGSSI